MLEIKERTVKSFPEFVLAIQAYRAELDSEILWYRGIAKASYILAPSIFRHHSVRNIDGAEKLEFELCKEFNFRYPSFNPVVRDRWDLLFLMQHYRVPTRMLDWTASPLTALFFALENSGERSEDAVVWAIDPRRWNSGMLSDISQADTIFSTDDEIMQSYHPTSPSTSKRAVPLAVEGIVNNPRINAQQGKIIIFGRSLLPMEEHAKRFDEWPDNIPICKIRIEKSAIGQMANDLNFFGVTYTTMFPDLEGLAMELKIKSGFHDV